MADGGVVTGLNETENLNLQISFNFQQSLNHLCHFVTSPYSVRSRPLHKGACGFVLLHI